MLWPQVLVRERQGCSRNHTLSVYMCQPVCVCWTLLLAPVFLREGDRERRTRMRRRTDSMAERGGDMIKRCWNSGKYKMIPSSVWFSVCRCLIWRVLRVKDKKSNTGLSWQIIHLFLVSPHIWLLDTLLTGVHFSCFNHTRLPPPTARSVLAPSRLPSCLVIYSKGPLIPGTGCEVLGVCRQRRWGMVGRRNGTRQAWLNITGSWCRVGCVDPRPLSTGRISEARFGFSAASPVSRHEACGL